MGRKRDEVEKSLDQVESQNSTNLLKTISDQVTMNSDSEVRFSGCEDEAAFSDKSKMTLDEFCLDHKLSAFSSNLLKEFGHTIGRETDVLFAINTDSSRLNKILGIIKDLTAQQMTHIFIQISGHKIAKSELTQHQKERMRLILSSYCFKNIASVLKAGGASDIYKKLMTEKLESYGLECQEATAYAKERYKYYGKEARVRLRKNGMIWLECSREEMKKLSRSLKN